MDDDEDFDTALLYLLARFPDTPTDELIAAMEAQIEVLKEKAEAAEDSLE